MIEVVYGVLILLMLAMTLLAVVASFTLMLVVGLAVRASRVVDALGLKTPAALGHVGAALQPEEEESGARRSGGRIL